jgi:hypothetical protein
MAIFGVNDWMYCLDKCSVVKSLIRILTESKMAHFSPFFTFFQLISSGYTPSKRQKLTKNTLVFANGRKILNKLQAL